MFAGIVPKDEGAAKVRFPFPEDGPEVQVHRIVLGEPPVAGLVVVTQERVRAAPHDTLVPVAADAKTAARQLVNFGAEFAFENSRPDQAVA